MNNLKERLGKRIGELRRSKRMTQEQLAEKTDYSVEFVSLVERGINAPSIEGCDRIAQALGMDLHELFAFTDDKTSRDEKKRS